MPAQSDIGDGARIAAVRLARHMTQRALSERARVSHSLLTKVESGSRPASDALVTACARALGVDPAVLTGRPHRGDPDTRELRELTVPIRHALDLFDLPPEEGVRPREIGQLRAAVRAINRLAQAANYRSMAARLPGLLAELHAAAHRWTGSHQVAAWGLLAEAYRSGTDAATPGALVAAGQLHLGASVIAARTGDHDPVVGHLGEAARIAASTGDQAETLWVAFGPTNVHAHRVMTAIEMGQFDDAIDRAADLHFPAGWLPTRIGHHHINLAGAYLGMNQPHNALAELFAARSVAPLQARRHPRVRRTVDALVRAERRRSARLASYVSWWETA